MDWDRTLGFSPAASKSPHERTYPWAWVLPAEPGSPLAIPSGGWATFPTHGTVPYIQCCGTFELLVWMLLVCPFLCLCGLSCTWVCTFWWFLCWWFLTSSRYTDVHSSHLFLYVITGRRQAKWIKTVGEYFMVLKVPASKEEIGDSLDKYSGQL